MRELAYKEFDTGTENACASAEGSLARIRRKAHDYWYNAQLSARTRSAQLQPACCALALAVGSVSSVRLAAEASRLGPTYLLLHAVLSLVLGVPAALLELGLGQFSQQGATAVWRAVPALRGVALVKLACSCACALWASVQVGVAAAYAVRTAAHALPMHQCTRLTMTELGYYQNNTLGLECALRTFLKPYSEDSVWFSIMCIIFFITWIIVPACLYSIESGYKYCTSVLGVVAAVLMVAVCAAVGEDTSGPLLARLATTDWSGLWSSHVWFAAAWQVLLSNRIGLAYLDTVGGTVYFGSNAVRWTFAMVGCNVAAGWLGAAAWAATTVAAGAAGVEEAAGRDSSVLAVLLWTYDAAVRDARSRLWPCLAFVAILCANLISMMSFLLPAVSGVARALPGAWRLAAAAGAAAAAAASMALFVPGLALLTYLERAALPFLVGGVVALQIAAFMLIYGWRAVLKDLQLMSYGLSPWWAAWWGLAGALLLACGCWEATSLARAGAGTPLAQRALLGALAAGAVALLLVCALVVVVQQDEYDLVRKIKSSFKPSRKWGPVEPILRHLWIQWRVNPHNAELVARVRAHRRGVGALSYGVAAASDASRKSSVEETDASGRSYYSRPPRSEEDGSKKSSLNGIRGSRKSSLEEIESRKSDVSSGKFSNRSSNISCLGVYRASSVSPSLGPGDGGSARSINENITHYNIRQLY